MNTEWYDWPIADTKVLCDRCNTGMAEVKCPDCGDEICPDCADWHDCLQEDGEK